MVDYSRNPQKTMLTANIYTTWQNNEFELEFIIELNLPENLSHFTDGEVICHIYPQDETCDLQADDFTALFLDKKNRWERLEKSVLANYEKVIQEQDEENAPTIQINY